MRVLCLCIFMLIGSPALAWLEPPPQRYMSVYRGALSIRMEPTMMLMRRCSGYACAYVAGHRCIVYLPSDQSPQIVAMLRQHELAHCNGWPRSHPR